MQFVNGMFLKHTTQFTMLSPVLRLSRVLGHRDHTHKSTYKYYKLSLRNKSDSVSTSFNIIVMFLIYKRVCLTIVHLTTGYYPLIITSLY